MKKNHLFLMIPLVFMLSNLAIAQSDPEKLFIDHADKCLETMKQTAEKLSVVGVAVVAYMPGEQSTTWISKMMVAGALANESANFLSIVYSKMGEMADTHMISGTAGREPLVGEFGWQGGVIKKIGSGYLLAAFSGGSGEQDAEIATKGLVQLSGFF